MTAKRYIWTLGTILILLFSAVLCMTPSVEAQKVHALLVIMDDDLDLRHIVDANRLNVKKMLQLLDVNPETWQADERRINPNHISEWIRNRQVSPEDTIFVYYSGHGHIDNKDRQYLNLDVQNAAYSLLRKDLADELLRKNCRLKMLITDTCSNRVETSPSIAKSAGAVVSRKQRYAKDLFLKHKGFLNITAASPGQYAWGNNQIGGYFTAALIQSFTASSDTDKDGFLSWKEVFLATRNDTQSFFSQATFLPSEERKVNEIGQTTQTPIAYTLPNEVPIFIVQDPSVKLMKMFSGYSSYIWNVEFSPKGTYFALTVDDNTTALYRLTNNSYKLIWHNPGSCTDDHHHAGAIAFSPSETYLAIGAHGDQKEITILRLSDLKIVQTLRGHLDVIKSVSFSPSGRYLASGSDDKTIRIWRFTGKNYTLHQTLKGHTDTVWCVSFDPTGNYLASGGRDHILKVWRWSGNQFTSVQTLRKHTDCVRSVSFNSTGKYLASGSCDGTIKIWQHANNEFENIQTLKDHTLNVWYVNYSPIGNHLVSSSADNTIKIWINNGLKFNKVHTFKHGKEYVNCVRFSPDGRYLASGGAGKTVKIWKVEGLHPQRRAETPVVPPVQPREINLRLPNRFNRPVVPPVPSKDQKALDFQVNDINGNSLSLKKYRGKVVLLDFWATWCGPCLVEMPNVKRIYQKYKKQNFQIIGISLDTDISKLRSYLKREGITWPQYFDGAGWENSIAQKYGINSIPRMYLIDGDGIIRKENVRGRALELAVSELVRENNRKSSIDNRGTNVR